jgi:hypothetical protein
VACPPLQAPCLPHPHYQVPAGHSSSSSSSSNNKHAGGGGALGASGKLQAQSAVQTAKQGWFCCAVTVFVKRDGRVKVSEVLLGNLHLGNLADRQHGTNSDSDQHGLATTTDNTLPHQAYTATPYTSSKSSTNYSPPPPGPTCSPSASASAAAAASMPPRSATSAAMSTPSPASSCDRRCSCRCRSSMAPSSPRLK